MQTITDELFQVLAKEKHDIIHALVAGIAPYRWKWVIIEETPTRIVIDMRRIA